MKILPLIIILMLAATVFAEEAVEKLKPEELAAALKDKKITENDLPKITSAQMTDDVLTQVPDLTKLKKEEFQKKFGLNFLNVDLKDKPLKYEKGLLLHPQGATLDIAKFNEYSTKANEAGYSLKVDESGFTLKKSIIDGNNELTFKGKIKGISLNEKGAVVLEKFGTFVYPAGQKAVSF